MTTHRSIDPIEDKFWTYLRGEWDESAFEAWLYADPDLVSVLGADNYLALAECDFRDVSRSARHERAGIARRIVTQLFARSCVCLSIPQDFRETMNSSASVVETHAKILARQTPWIELVHCCDCGLHWLVGTDTVDDYFNIRRVSVEVAAGIVAHDRWPEFDDWANLWPDIEWLNAFGFDSLDAWRATNDPSRSS